MPDFVFSILSKDGFRTVMRETAPDFAARMAQRPSNEPQIWASLTDDPNPRLVSVRLSGVDDWQIEPCEPAEEVLARLRGQRQLLSVGDEEPLNWFVKVTDTHGQFNEAPLDLSLDRDVRGVFWIVNHHCWGQAEAERLETLLERAQLESLGPQYLIEDLLRMPNTHEQ